ncbi:pseudaminic acid synthase [Thermodesulfobacteriota bacterium]
MTELIVSIASRKIGPDYPPYVIAELSGNHNGDINRAFKVMEAAQQAGADAVKLQTYTADTITIDHDGPGFTIESGLWAGKNLYQLYQEAFTPWGWHQALFERGRELGITVFSTPFDATAVDFLEELGAPAYKIASFEMIDLALIEKVATTGKPLIISTGMADAEEIEEAVRAARQGGCRELILLHCVSGYPTPSEEANLRVIPVLSDHYKVPVGLSDHTKGVATAITCVGLGASVIEKHVTLRRSDGGPDAAFSLEPEELQLLCQQVKIAWSSLGSADFTQTPSEEHSLIFRRSLYVVRDMEEGDIFSKENVRSIRPGYGLAPKNLSAIVGRRASGRIRRGTPLDWLLVR